MVQDPKSIGRYQVQSLLGRGGMGSVFLALDPLLKRQVVVKVVHEGGAGFAHAMERFQREAEISARLNHPNIITVHDVGQDPQVGPFIAMEYVEGATLAGLIQQQSLSHESGLKILVQAARGLMAAAHEGIVHRDVKPENILVGKDGRVKLTDFGIARTGESKLTTVGGVFGTPSYIAPELLVDAEASPATDTYAFAVTAYELLTGALPFKGDSVASTLLRIVNDPPTVPDAVPTAPRIVFLKALAKKPAERYPDVYSFMAALVQTYPLPASTRAKLATLLAGEDVSLTGIQLGGPLPGHNTPLPSSQFPAPPTSLAPPAAPAAAPSSVAHPPVSSPPRPAPPPRTPTPPQPMESQDRSTRPAPPPPPVWSPAPGAGSTLRRDSGPVDAPAITQRRDSGPVALAGAERRPDSGELRPSPPAALEFGAPKSSSKSGLLAALASASGALLLLAIIYVVIRVLGFGSRELSLDTNPSGAVVKIDGKEMGLSPLVKASVPKKAERLELSLPGYESKTIALLPKDRDLQVIELRPLGGAKDEAPSDDPEIEAMRRKVRELEAQNQREAERLKKLREQGARSGSNAPQSAPQPPPPSATAPTAVPTSAPAAPPLPTPPSAPVRPGSDPGQVTGPVVLKRVAPQYPPRAVAARFEPNRSHRVILRVFVDEAGRPGKIQVVEGVLGPYGFDEAAKEAALQSTYVAGSKGGRPAAGWVEITFVFQAMAR